MQASSKVRVLWFDGEEPCAANSGGRKRTKLLLEALVKHCEITLVTLDHPGFVDTGTEHLPVAHICLMPPKDTLPDRLRAALLAITSLIPGSRWAERSYDVTWVRNELARHLIDNSYDVAYVDHPVWGVYFDIFKEHDMRVVVELDDILAEYYRDAFMIARKRRLEAALEYIRSLRFQRRGLKAADAIVVTKTEDTNAIVGCGAPSPFVVANPVDLSGKATECRFESPTIVFTGNLDLEFNIDAMNFLQEIWRKVVEADSSLRLHVVGRRHRHEALGITELPNVSVYTNVRNIDDWLGAESILVAPIRHGAGSSVRVLEAMANDTAVIATSVALRGMSVSNGNEVALCSTADEFAEAIVLLAHDEDYRAVIRRNAREYVAKRHTKEAVIPNLLLALDHNKTTL